MNTTNQREFERVATDALFAAEDRLALAEANLELAKIELDAALAERNQAEGDLERILNRK